MFYRSWPNNEEHRRIQLQINECLKFIRNRVKGKVSAAVYLRCVWIENQLAACQDALDTGNRQAVTRMLNEIDWRIVELYKD
jgi:hypothetical protein